MRGFLAFLTDILCTILNLIPWPSFRTAQHDLFDPHPRLFPPAQNGATHIYLCDSDRTVCNAWHLALRHLPYEFRSRIIILNASVRNLPQNLQVDCIAV